MGKGRWARGVQPGDGQDALKVQIAVPRMELVAVNSVKLTQKVRESLTMPRKEVYTVRLIKCARRAGDRACQASLLSSQAKR
jgi:hypothetical protein